MSGSITIGHRTIVAAGYDLQDMANDEIDRQLEAARVDYEAGHLHALVDAVSLLRTHRADHLWPEWVQVAVTSAVQRSAASPPRGVWPTRTGRHAKDSTRHRDDACDLIRATWIDGLLLTGSTMYAASKAVSLELDGSGDAAGSPKVMGASHKRFHQRLQDAPHRYAAVLMDWRGMHLLRCLMKPRK